MRLPWILPVGTAALLLAVPPASAFRPSASPLEFPLAFEAYEASAAGAPFATAGPDRALGAGPGWRLQTDPETGHVRMAYGGRLILAGSVRTAEAAETLAASFLRAHEAESGVRADNSSLRNVRHAGGKWAVHFRQVVDGVPVWATTAFVLIGDNGRVAAFGSGFRPEPRERGVHPALSSAAAEAKAASALGTTVRADRPASAELAWVPAPGEEAFELALAYRVVFEVDEPFGRWETFVRADTGEILARRNLYFPIDVAGETRGLTAANPPSYGWCDGYGPYRYANLDVSIVGGSTATSDAAGEFLIPNAGSAPVDVTAQLSGPFTNVHRYPPLGIDAMQTMTVDPRFPFTLRWTAENSRSDERTTFYHTNVVHEFMKALDPTFTQIDYSMPTIVGRADGFCPGNAWWDGHGMNFCASGERGTSYYNTGTLGNVIYHEYGHGVTQFLYQRNGAPDPPSGLHEGNSDIIANFIDRNPVIGLGFSSGTGCGTGIRTAVNDLTYPAENETGGHRAGQVIEAFHWLAWQAMLADLTREEADATAFRTWHEGRDLGTPRTFPDQVLWTFLADDDDADLSNGTPHFDFLCPAAAAKGFECPDVPGPIQFTPKDMPHVTDGSAGFDLVATVVSTEGAIDAATVTASYRVNGSPFTDVVMMPTGNADEYTAHLGPVARNSAVEYWFEASDLAGNVGTSPAHAPAALHVFDVAYAVDDLEHGVAGWTIGLPDDDAMSGWWDLFDPVGTAAEPEDDATPGAGTMCFLTGQCANGEGSCTTSCQISCNDVDGGRTVLLTPVYDLEGATGVKIRYSRWFSADQGAVADDAWVVDASNDGGASWANAVTSTSSATAWVDETVDIDGMFGAPGRVQLRFVASDMGEGSIVEAAVDDIRVFAQFGPTDASVVSTPAAPARLALEASRPNPFRAATRVDFALPRASAVRLAVYDVSGRMVRTLLSEPRDAGRYRAEWDGRSTTGARVAAGVYFFRLAAEGEALTRKVTVMP